MKISIVDNYYPRFLDSVYQTADMARRNYVDQQAALLATCFGTSDFYSRHLKSLGHDASDIIANATPLQTRWAKENGVTVNRLLARISPRWQRLPVVGKFLARAPGLLSIALEQVRRTKPDVLYLQDLSLIPPDVLRSLKAHVGLVVGQIACPLPPSGYLDPYDLILTSFPHFVERFRKMGIASEYFRIAFDPIVLEKLGVTPKRYRCSFVGGISPAHQRGTQFLEYMASNADVDFFGYGRDSLRADSPIRPRHHGEVWGLPMYRALAQSEITLNRHIDVAEGYANNMRLFEATGCGAMLLTDAKSNLHELFEVGKEAVAYNSPEEAVELVKYYMDHPGEREAIARAGQQRTLRDHTYRQRMEELVEILQRHLKKRG